MFPLAELMLHRNLNIPSFDFNYNLNGEIITFWILLILVFFRRSVRLNDQGKT